MIITYSWLDGYKQIDHNTVIDYFGDITVYPVPFPLNIAITGTHEYDIAISALKEYTISIGIDN